MVWYRRRNTPESSNRGYRGCSEINKLQGKFRRVEALSNPSIETRSPLWKPIGTHGDLSPFVFNPVSRISGISRLGGCNVYWLFPVFLTLFSSKTTIYQTKLQKHCSSRTMWFGKLRNVYLQLQSGTIHPGVISHLWPHMILSHWTPIRTTDPVHGCWYSTLLINAIGQAGVYKRANRGGWETNSRPCQPPPHPALQSFSRGFCHDHD